MADTLFYQGHLNRVSRSFAFCIARLEGDLRDWVSLSYLLCRLLDTVEDALWERKEDQENAFARFQDFLAFPPSSGEVAAWSASFPEGIEPGEALLLSESHRCFSAFHELPASVRSGIGRPVLDMSRGMRHFLRERRARGELRLGNLAEVNQYCFFVAGLVGGLLTDLVALRRPGFARSRRLYQDAHHFGLFLQKINLLKDQAKDESEGRFLVPSRKELLASLAQNAEGALRYLQALPLAERGYRLFCAWSLYLGLASLPWIERSSLIGAFLKIPRLVTEALLGRVEKLIDDNQALVKLFWEMLPPLPALGEDRAGPKEIPWMDSVYSGSLDSEDFLALGMRVPAGAH